MSHAYHHSLSSVKRWGGKVDDYLPIHTWFDESKAYMADPRHRALRHHTQGIFESENYFGTYITNSDEKVVPVRLIGEQHVKEDCGFIPTVNDWFKLIKMETWMVKPARLSENE